jgi:NAD(P)-dependent dehydrogenase (short-subunit alcohol dehydrogenase family)
MVNDLRGKAVIITGGTKGIGLAAGLSFARQGAECTLTHKWGSADEEPILEAFAAAGATPPRIVNADVSSLDDTMSLLADLKKSHDHIEAFISNVGFGHVVHGLDDYVMRSLFKTIEYSAWPLHEYPRCIREVFGRYPRYVVGLSSRGPDAFTTNYDFVAASKAVLETFCKYLSHRLFAEGVRVNIVRAGLVRTDSLRSTLGDGVEAFVEKMGRTHPFVAEDEVAGAILALCSGLMDGVSGQILTIDHGDAFSDNLMGIHSETTSPL